MPNEAETGPLRSAHKLNLLAMLDELGISLLETTYRAGKLFLVGRKPDDSITVFERTPGLCMGM